MSEAMDKEFFRERVLLKAIQSAQEQFILAADPRTIFEALLEPLLTLTDSQYGFIYEMFYTPEGKPYLTARAITDISWSDESRKMYSQFITGTLTFSNLKSLFGAAMTTGKAVIANDAPNDPRRAGIPNGHPPLNAFLGLPLISSSKEFVGLIGLANRPGGYTEDLIKFLDPLVLACANLIGARKNDQRRLQVEQELARVRDELKQQVQWQSEENKTLRFESQKLAKSIESIAIMAEVDREGHIVQTNLNFDTSLGYTPLEMRGMDWKKVIHVGDHESVSRAYEEMSEAGLSAAEVRAIRKDASLCYRRLHLVRIADNEGRFLGHYCFMTDMEAELEARTEKQRNERLEIVNKELEQFSNVASHDLQEPLRLMRMYSQLLEKQFKNQLDETGQQYIGFISSAATRMQELIRGLLAFAKAGASDPPMEDVDIAFALKQALEQLKAAIDESGTEITYGSMPLIRGNLILLTQLFQNLIGNAIKFHANNRQPKIRVEAQHLGNEWVVSVRDNGIGFSSEDADKVFVMFRRLHSQQEYSGTGIGLGICKKIVERHGGRIWTESESGQGAKFFFSIPDPPRRFQPTERRVV